MDSPAAQAYHHVMASDLHPLQRKATAGVNVATAAGHVMASGLHPWQMKATARDRLKDVRVCCQILNKDRQRLKWCAQLCRNAAGLQPDCETHSGFEAPMAPMVLWKAENGGAAVGGAASSPGTVVSHVVVAASMDSAVPIVDCEVPTADSVAPTVDSAAPTVDSMAEHRHGQGGQQRWDRHSPFT